MHRSAAFASALLLAALGGSACKQLGREYLLSDTEGWPYRASCVNGDCGREVQSPHAARPDLACGAGEHPGFALAGRGVVVACHACVGGGGARVDPARCRPLRCATDGDCPPRHQGAPARCLRQLCQVPSQPALDPVAAAGLCMAGAGPSGEPGEAVAARLAFARAACDPSGRCTPPPACRAP